MACRTPSVKRVADKTVKAKEQIDKLNAMLKRQHDAKKAEFYKKIDGHLADALVTDAREVTYNSDIKIEYVHEFSLDAIANVVTSALKAAAKAKNTNVENPVMSPEAVQAYTDLVNTVAEAAKSTSTSSASLSFSMNRLSPGLFAFLFAESLSIQETETFGKEAVTATAVYYRIMESIEDIQLQAKFEAARIDYQNLLNMKTLQAGLTDQLAKGDITIDTWMTLDKNYSKALEQIQARLDASGWHPAEEVAGIEKMAAQEVIPVASANHKLVRASIDRLSAMGADYAVVVERSKERLANDYY